MAYNLPLKNLRGKPTGKRALVRPRSRWKDNRMDLREIAINTSNWVDSTQETSLFFKLFLIHHT